jgi:hypothetical protein
MSNLGFIPSFMFSMDPAINPNVVDMPFPPGMTQTTVQPVGPYMFGMAGLGEVEPVPMPMSTKIYGFLSLLSGAAMAYHGVKRNHGSIGWGIWWGFAGALFPIFVPILSVAQKPGFAKPK